MDPGYCPDDVSVTAWILLRCQEFTRQTLAHARGLQRRGLRADNIPSLSEIKSIENGIRQGESMAAQLDLAIEQLPPQDLAKAKEAWNLRWPHARV